MIKLQKLSFYLQFWWLWNFVSYADGRTRIQGFWEQGAEKKLFSSLDIITVTKSRRGEAATGPYFEPGLLSLHTQKAFL
jgi:hypothetical protein